MLKVASYPVMNGGIEPSASGYIEQYNENENTIIISQGGASAGYINFMLSKFWAGAHFYVIKTNINNKYLYYFLKNKQNVFLKSQRGARIPNLDRKFLSKLLIPIP